MAAARLSELPGSNSWLGVPPNGGPLLRLTCSPLMGTTLDHLFTRKDPLYLSRDS